MLFFFLQMLNPHLGKKRPLAAIWQHSFQDTVVWFRSHNLGYKKCCLYCYPVEYLCRFRADRVTFSVGTQEAPIMIVFSLAQFKGQSHELRMCGPKLKTWKILQNVSRLTRLKKDGGCKRLWRPWRRNSGRKKQFLTWNTTYYSGLRTDDVFCGEKYISVVACSKIRGRIWVF